jgi:hypothetical protein
MSVLEMSRFQAALDFHDEQGRATPLTKLKNERDRKNLKSMDYNLDALVRRKRET